MNEITIGIRFHNSGRIYNFDPGNLDLEPGHNVMVETEQGLTMGRVHYVNGPNLMSEHPNPDFHLKTLPAAPLAEANISAEEPDGEAIFNAAASPAEHEEDDDVQAADLEPPSPPLILKKILRIATSEDLMQIEKNRDLEKKALQYCRQKIEELKLNMTLVKAESHFDRSKMVIYFTSDERLDFRELVYDLAARLRGRIELRQIGVRQEAKMLGGLGSCGRELCCSHFLKEFTQVGVKMAKEQCLSLNPATISGLCGRLMCCLSYEFETYRSLNKEMPKVGKKIKIHPELEGKVLRHSPLSGQLTLQLSDGRTVTCTLQEMQSLLPVKNTRWGSASSSASKPVEEDENQAPVTAGPVLAVDDDEIIQAFNLHNKRRSRRTRRRKKNEPQPTGAGADESRKS
jgi:cell fate regulator YaaT (PSP1 superfamily)